MHGVIGPHTLASRYLTQKLLEKILKVSHSNDNNNNNMCQEVMMWVLMFSCFMRYRHADAVQLAPRLQLAGTCSPGLSPAAPQGSRAGGARQGATFLQVGAHHAHLVNNATLQIYFVRKFRWTSIAHTCHANHHKTY
jgi:hypothetical protein